MNLRPHQACPELAEGVNENNATIFILIPVLFYPCFLISVFFQFVTIFRGVIYELGTFPFRTSPPGQTGPTA